MSFLREYAATQAAGRTALTLRWLAMRPRELFRELQAEQPVFSTPGFVLVTRYADAMEVLTRGDVFGAQALEARRQALFGGFSLDERDGPQAAVEAAVVRLCVRGEDADQAGIIAQEAANAALASGRVAASYFGIGSPEENSLVQWVDAIARDVEDNPGDDVDIHEEARSAVAELGGYLDAVIGARRSQKSYGRTPTNDVLGRLLALQDVPDLRLDERRVRDVMLGLLVASIERIAASIALALGELVDRPGALQVARQAIEGGDDAAVWAVLREALRFSPPRQTVSRICTQPYTLAQGTANEVTLRPGATVLVALGAASFDPERVDDAEHFRLNRPEQHDFLFGHGPHACLGRQVATAAIREGCKPLLAGEFRLSGPLRRTPNGRPIAFPVEVTALRAAG